MSVRRDNECSFDHGAQFFTARSEEFQSAVNTASDAGIVHHWSPKVVTLEAGKKTYKREWFEPHYRGSRGMNSLAKFFAEKLACRFSFTVDHLEKNHQGWLLVNDSGEKEGPFDWVVSSAPAPQTATLLPTIFTGQSAIAGTRFHGCYALMLQYHTPIQLNFGAALAKHPVIAWLSAGEQSTGKNSLLIHSDNSWATEHIDAELPWVESQMTAALVELLPATQSPITHSDLHRWRYAKCEDMVGEDYLLDEINQLAAIGDWCRGNRVEDAFLSGYRLAQTLKRSLSSQ